MIVIKVNYTTDAPIIKVNYDDAPIYITTSVDATYINVDYGTGGGGSGAVWGDIIGTLSDQLDLQAALDGKVPYTGATGNVDLGEYQLKAGQLTLDTTPTGTAAVGTTRWNDTIGSSETTLKGGSVILKNGVDLVVRVVNKVTPNATLTKAQYQAVRVSGAQGQRLAVAYAQANNDNNSADTIGLVTETIATNQEGFVMTVGSLEGINTTGSLQGETWSDGDVIYLSPFTAGALTNVKPSAPSHIVVIGYVEYAHANNGKLYVKIMNGWELEELHDCAPTPYIDKGVLYRDTTTNLWKSATISTLLGYTPGTVTSVALSVPTGLVITSGSPVTTSGTIAVGLQSGYSIPTTIKQGNWDDAYTFVSGFPSQTGNSGKYLTTDGSTLSWGTISTANIYNSDGTLTGNRTVTMGSNTLSFSGDILVNGLSIGKGFSSISTNTAVGSTALNANTTGNNNTAIGQSTLRFNTTGTFNVALGTEALYANVTGSNNIAIGTYSLLLASAPSGNIAIGHYSMANVASVGVQNIGIGQNTLYRSTGGRNVAIGYLASQNITSAEYSTAVGWVALGANTTGVRNTAIGASSLQSVNTGQYNIALGQSSGYALTSGSYNIMIGSELGGVSTGSYNTIIGTNITPAQLSASLSNNIILADGQGNMRLVFDNSGNAVLGGTTSYPTFAGYKLDVQGTGRFTGQLTSDSYQLGGGQMTISYSSPNVNIRWSNAGWNLVFGNSAGTNIARYTVNDVNISDLGSFTSSNSSILTLASTTKGFLPPRMTSAQRTAISTPATGLVVYQTDATEGLYQYLSTGWSAVGGGTNIYNSDGTLTGNRTVTTSTNKLLFTDGTNGIAFKNVAPFGGLGGYYGVFASGVTPSNTNYALAVSANGNFIAFNSSNGIYFNYNDSPKMYLSGSTGNFIVGGTTDAGYKLDVQGTGRFTGDVDGKSYFATGALTSKASGSYTFIDFQSTYGRVGVFNFTAGTWLPLLTGDSQVVLSNTTTARTERLVVPSTAYFSGNVKMVATSNYFGATENNAIFSPATYSNANFPAIENDSIGIIAGVNSVSNPAFIIATKISFQIGTGSNSKIAQFTPTSGNFIIQNGGTFTDVSSALIQMNSTTKGFLPPRMTSTQRTAISSPAVGLIVYQTDATEGTYEYTSSGWRLINAAGSGGGITRSVNNISTTTTAGATASTDYVYLVSGTTTLTMPTAVGNTNRYTIKNVGINTITINTTSSQTIDGSTTINIAVQYTTLDLISDGTNWNII